MSAEYYCEICGKRIEGRPIYADVDGSHMYLCFECYEKLSRSGLAKPVRESGGGHRGFKAPTMKARRRRRASLELYDLVEDYAERIRAAIEAKGWSTAVLAQKLRISESMLRKIESGKVKPSIELARRIESLLKVKLLEPVVDEESYYSDEDEDYLTFGDIVVVKRDED